MFGIHLQQLQIYRICMDLVLQLFTISAVLLQSSEISGNILICFVLPLRNHKIRFHLRERLCESLTNGDDEKLRVLGIFACPFVQKTSLDPTIKSLPLASVLLLCFVSCNNGCIQIILIKYIKLFRLFLIFS